MKNYIIKYLKILPIPLISIIIMSITYSITNLIGFKVNKLITLIIMIIVMFISGYLLSNQINKKKYLHGLIFGVATATILFIISLLYKPTYNLNTLLYYLVVSLSSMFGSMLSSIKK